MPVPVRVDSTSPSLGGGAGKRPYAKKPDLYQLLSAYAPRTTDHPLARGHPAPPERRHNMFRDNHAPITLPDTPKAPEKFDHLTAMQADRCSRPPLQWDWDIEHEDRRKEAKADAAVHNAQPFQVDRKLLKDIVQTKTEVDVVRIQFLGAGTFHKGYLITLIDGRELVARVARRFMPRLKTESEVATMLYMREHTSIPVPTIYDYDSNPYNRLGGEYILMSKARGVPLASVFQSLGHNELIALMGNLARLLMPLFAHRFPRIGSLYLGPDPDPLSDTTSTIPTPTATSSAYRGSLPSAVSEEYFAQKGARTSVAHEYHVGPIISWPFFGSGRGELAHPHELNRGPWRSTHDYLEACAAREAAGVVLEHEGKAAPHRLHLDPDEIASSRHHHIQALPGDESDKSDEWDWEESEQEWEGPGDSMYRDYRRMQRTTFLVAHLKQREERVKEEMARFLRMMERLGAVSHEEGDGGGGEEFGLDCHDLSLENVFVDEHDHSQISCIIDWESTTTRPLWACAHVPSFLQSSPFTAKLLRATIERLTKESQTIIVKGQMHDLATIASDWLHHEAAGARLRMAHRCIEWDGWEEGLVDSILGPEDQEEDWFKSWEELAQDRSSPGSPGGGAPYSPLTYDFTEEGSDSDSQKDAPAKPKRAQVQMAAKVVAVEKAKEKLLNATGDVCGGRGGELGRRLEAWLHVSGDGDGRVGLSRRWEGAEEETVV
ncbi:hypothetical protein CERSUDRAFT_119156 [Gelatoporia subvermispora B]|uniref:Altered inheritance of mitochondria protein 9, mitochondrial n=1 Tax=Ceriporiopsis subvermispora (strain B) TaxID=914234 RepID=M2QZA8_CERS8|nr:hypothetical protein CERSUDRAFT_119156 [Gelatoporia subvermispora B]